MLSTEPRDGVIVHGPGNTKCDSRTGATSEIVRAASRLIWDGNKMKWKVVIVGPAGTVDTDTDAFKLLYSYPTLEEAEEHAKFLRIVGMKVALCDEQGNLTQPTE
jgi:hypothetical protein